MKKFALLLVAALLVVTSLVLPVQAAKADEPVTCHFTPWLSEFSASECDNYIIRIGWVSTARGLANEFQKAIHSSISIYKEGGGFDLAYNEQQSAQFWWIMPFPADTFGWDCAMPTLWANRWWVPVPVDLEPGNYVATYTWTLDHPVNDGWEACERGKPIGKTILSGTVEDSYYFTITP